MKPGTSDSAPRTDGSSRLVAGGLVGMILLSFASGVILYLPAEQRARKLEEMRVRYEAKYNARLRVEPSAPAVRR